MCVCSVGALCHHGLGVVVVVGGVFKTLKWIHVKRRQPVRASQNPARGTSNRADESEQTAAVSGCLDRRR